MCITVAALSTLAALCLTSGCNRTDQARRAIESEAAWPEPVQAKPAAPAAITATQPAPTPKPGESEAEFSERVKSAQRLIRAQVEADAERRIAEIKAQAKVDAAQAREDARSDFYEQTRRWTGWAMLALGLVAVAALVLSFFPFGRAVGLDVGDSAKAGGAVVVVSLARYALLRYGVLAGDIAGYGMIFTVVIAAIALAWLIGKQAMRGTLRAQVEDLWAKGEARAATAVEAIADNKTRNKHAADRKARLAANSSGGGAA